MVEFADPVRREIWATVRALNDCWTTGDPAGLTAFFHPDMVAVTPTDRHRLEGGRACAAAWAAFARATRIHRWDEIDPVIHVYGEAAVVAYDFVIDFAMDGREISLAGRDLFFFVRQDGRWWAVGDQFSPYPV